MHLPVVVGRHVPWEEVVGVEVSIEPVTACDGRVVEQRSVVGVAEADLEVADVAEQRCSEGVVPLVDRQGAVVVPAR